MPRYVVALGSCHPLGCTYLKKAESLMAKCDFITIHGKSDILKNPSVGMSVNRVFYNNALAIFSPREPLVLYRELRAIELKLGRIRSYKNSPRTIDLDILLSFELNYQSGTFFVPHKQLLKRDFFLICAKKAIKQAGWPLPYSLLHAHA